MLTTIFVLITLLILFVMWSAAGKNDPLGGIVIAFIVTALTVIQYIILMYLNFFKL